MNCQDRRAGALAARGLGAGLAVALTAGVVGCHRGEETSGGGASETGLVVQAGRDMAKLQPNRLLGCYVGGRLIGQRTVADCARRNGLPTGALDVGLAAGSPAAASSTANATSVDEPAGEPASSPPPPAVTAAGGLADCAQLVDGAWVRVAQGATLTSCVRTLFDGQCLAEGVVSRGRWADRLLRLANGRVEAAAAGAPYRLVAVQADGCATTPTPGTEG